MVMHQYSLSIKLILFLPPINAFQCDKKIASFPIQINYQERRSNMGRDNKQGQTNNASSLPQTPKQEKISARAAQEEFSRELSQLEQLVLERKRNKKNK